MGRAGHQGQGPGEALTRRAAAGLHLLGAAVRLYGLRSKSLWFDEARALAAVLEPLSRLLPALRVLERHPPLYHLLAWPAVRLAADPVTALRGLSCLFGLLGLGAAALLASRLDAEARAPFLLLSALSPAAVEAAQSARPYALLLLLTTLSYERLLAWRQGGGRRALGQLALVDAALLLTHFYGIYVVAVQTLLAAAWAPDRRSRAEAWTAMGLSAVPLACWLPGFLAVPLPARPPSLAGPKTLFFCMGATLADFSFITMFWDRQVAVFGAALALLAALGWRAARRRGSDLALWGGLGAFLPFAAAWALAAAGRPIIEARFFTVCQPPLYALLAAAAARVPGRWSARARLGAALALAGALAARAAAVRALDPRLDLLADAARRLADARTPVVHLAAFDYLPLRYYYLADRRHYMAPSAIVDLDGHALPGGDAYLPADWERLGDRFLVVDAERRAGAGRLFAADRAGLRSVLALP